MVTSAFFQYFSWLHPIFHRWTPDLRWTSLQDTKSSLRNQRSSLTTVRNEVGTECRPNFAALWWGDQQKFGWVNLLNSMNFYGSLGAFYVFFNFFLIGGYQHIYIYVYNILDGSWGLALGELASVNQISIGVSRKKMFQLGTNPQNRQGPCIFGEVIWDISWGSNT